MARNAGFGVVAEISEGVINDILAAYWSDLTHPVEFHLPAGVQIGGETIALDATLQILAPSIRLVQRPDNLISVTASCGGILIASVGSAAPVAAVVSLSTTIAAGIAVVDLNKYLVPTIDLSGAVVSNLAVVVQQGPALPATVNQALSSSPVLSAVQAALRAVPASLLALGTSTVPDSLTANGVTASFGNVAVIPTNGMLTIAADLIGYTQGSVSALVDLTTAPATMPIVWTYDEDGALHKDGGGYGIPGAHCNVVATVNGPALMAFLNGPVATAVTQLQLPHGAHIDSIQFSLGSYQDPLESQFWPGVIVQIGVSDSVASGSITIDFGIRGVEPGSGTTEWLTQQSPATWNFLADNVTISVGVVAELLAIAIGPVIGFAVPAVGPLVLVALAMVLDGVVPGLIANFEQQAQAAINAGIQSGSSFGGSVPADYTGTLPGTSSAQCTVNTRALVISPDGFDSCAVVNAAPTGGASPSLTIAGGSLTSDYQYEAIPQIWILTLVIPPNGALNQYPYFLRTSDPTIHVAWSVDGPNINGTAYASDTPITNPDSFTKTLAFDPNSPEFIHNNGLSITASIYRLIDGMQWPIWSGTIQTYITDDLDITHWYANWSHSVYFSTASNARTVRFSWSRKRHSVIHKTNRLQRCANVTTAAVQADRKNRQLNYFDTLPFPASEAEQKRRGNLCDYCFFGGPHGHHFTP